MVGFEGCFAAKDTIKVDCKGGEEIGVVLDAVLN